MNEQTQQPGLIRYAESEPSALSMIAAVIERGVTADNVAALRELVQLKRDMDADAAKKSFVRDFVLLKQALPTIEGARAVNTKTGELKFKYANFDDIDAVVCPICLQHGFTYSFAESEMKDGRVTMLMTLMHKDGHSISVPFTVRIGSGPPGATESQADMSGHEYAKRGALEAGLSLRIIGKREDAAEEGTPITQEQAFELERRVKETNSNVEAFLKFANAPSFFEIKSERYAELDGFLRRKESRGK